MSGWPLVWRTRFRVVDSTDGKVVAESCQEWGPFTWGSVRVSGESHDEVMSEVRRRNFWIRLATTGVIFFAALIVGGFVDLLLR